MTPRDVGAALLVMLGLVACGGAERRPCAGSPRQVVPQPPLHPVPLALDRWRRIVVDSERPGRAVFVLPVDLDHDGKPEILAGAWVYAHQERSLERWSRQPIGGGLGNVAAVADFNGDGRLDALGTRGKGDDPVSAEFVLRLGDGCGGFERGQRIQRTRGDFLQGVAVGHFASEKGLEVALSWHEAKNGIQLLVPPTGAAGALAWNRISDVSQDEQLTAADLDRDGRTDLVMGTLWLRNLPAGFTLDTIDADSTPPDRNRVADVDGDGWPDVVVGFLGISVPAPLRWYRNPGSTGARWTRQDIAEVVGPMSLDLGDLDADGDVDVVVGEHNLKHPASARLLIYENLGAGKAWKQHVVYTGDEHHDGAQLLDADGDGDLDIVSIGWGHSKVLLYQNLAIP
jgi:hypothetical protein